MTRPVHAQTPGPAWSTLSAEQKTILGPLQQDWDRLDPERRKRWINVATRYPNLPPDRQQRIQQRMHEWASLTPEQRTKARERFKQLRQLPADKHHELNQRWHEYQQLPEEQRQKLRDNRGASRKPGQ